MARLPIPEAMRPRSVTIRFSDAGPQRLSTMVEVIDPRGAVLRADSTSTLDGSPTPVPGVLVMQLARGGQPASTRIYTVSADGQSMTETVACFNDAGQPALRANLFQRAAR